MINMLIATSVSLLFFFSEMSRQECQHGPHTRVLSRNLPSRDLIPYLTHILFYKLARLYFASPINSPFATKLSNHILLNFVFGGQKSNVIDSNS